VEEREELSRFIRHDLRDGVGAGILRGLFLLLKANRLYLDQLPGSFDQKLVQPMRDFLLRMEKSMASLLETQRQIALRSDGAIDKATQLVERLDSIVPKVENIVQRSVDNVDTTPITRQISDSLMKSTVEPISQTNDELLKTARLLSGLIEKAKEILEMLHKIAWRKMLLGSLGLTFVFWFVIFIFACQGMQRSFDSGLEEQNQKLIALSATISGSQGTTIGNQAVCDELSRLQVTLDVKPVYDGDNHYQLTLPHAYEAKVLPDGTGVISFQGADLTALILQQIEENKKMSHH
jgi:hypothetical protein